MAKIGKKFVNFFVEDVTDEVTYEDMIKEIEMSNDTYEFSQEQESNVYEIEITDIASIEEIYEKAGISDLSNSVYKVEEIRSVLPSTLSASAKKESVLGMMQVSKITPEEVIEDASKRTAVLKGALDSFTNETIKVVETNTAEIVELENRIDALKDEINNRQLSQEQQEQLINNESVKIDSIIKFIS